MPYCSEIFQIWSLPATKISKFFEYLFNDLISLIFFRLIPSFLILKFLKLIFNFLLPKTLYIKLIIFLYSIKIFCFTLTKLKIFENSPPSSICLGW